MKTGVIPDNIIGMHVLMIKGWDPAERRGQPPRDGLASYQLVGEVTAHQGV